MGSLEERLLIGGMDVSLKLVPPVRGESPTEGFSNSKGGHTYKGKAWTNKVHNKATMTRLPVNSLHTLLHNHP